MRPDLATLERLAESPGPLRGLDARAKIVATVAFVVLVVATPAGDLVDARDRGGHPRGRRRRLSRADPLHRRAVAGLPRARRVPRGDGRAGASGAGAARLVGGLGRDPGEEQPGVRRRPDPGRDHADAAPPRRARSAGRAGHPRLDAPFHGPLRPRPRRRAGPDDAGPAVADVPPVGPARLGAAHRPDRHAPDPLVRARGAGPRRDARPGLGRDDPDPRRGRGRSP